MAEAHLAARYNRAGFEIVDHYTYGIVSDGDLMEGVASEAASLAGHLQLGKLIYLYDDNHVTLSAGTDITFTEDCARRFEAYGWHTQSIEDGNDLAAIDQALRAARAETRRPSLILVRTHLGYGSPAQAGHVRGARLAAGCGRSAPDQAESGLADRAAVLRSRCGARTFSRSARSVARRRKRSGTPAFSSYSKAFPELAQRVAADVPRRIACRLGCGHSGLRGRCQRHGHARRVGQGDECHRAATAGADRRLGGSRSFDPHRAQGVGRLRAVGHRCAGQARIRRRRLDLRRPQSALRRARARHGRDPERARLRTVAPYRSARRS